MAKFRKKPVVIEAVQVFGGPMGWHTIRDFVGKALYPYFLNPSQEDIHMDTPGGRMCLRVGDWIIKEVNGEFNTYKPDIFEKTYEAVIEPTVSRDPNGCEIPGDTCE